MPPAKPPRITAIGSRAPAPRRAVSSSPIVVVAGTSSRLAPDSSMTVDSTLAPAAVPTAGSAVCASRASDSTFATSVGRPWTPTSYGRGGLRVGLASPPSIARTTAVSSPATYAASTVTSVGTGTVHPGTWESSSIAVATLAAASRVGDEDEQLVGVDDGRGDAQAVEDQVRSVAQQPAVLDRCGLALLAVGDGDPGTVGVGDRCELARHGESGSAPPVERGLLHGAVQVGARRQRAVATGG